MPQPFDNHFLLELLHPCDEGAGPEPPRPTSPRLPPAAADVELFPLRLFIAMVIVGGQVLCRCKVWMVVAMIVAWSKLRLLFNTFEVSY